jgi:UDP-N-acetylglucosamine 2-epimerase (non-hydrolysing)
MAAMKAAGDVFQQVLVHTGQHYDARMSQIFFEDLDLPEPDEHLNVGSGSHAWQTAQVMTSFEPVLLKHRPDWVFVVGDVNSTLACALVSVKLGIPAAHVEAGLRSWDRSMPEEINRILTDQIADLLFTPSEDGDANLLREGIPAGKIHRVGNIMIDSLVRMLPKARQQRTAQSMSLEPGKYVLVTLHRPSNVDQPETLQQVLTALEEIALEAPVIFPVHPRTRKTIQKAGWQLPNIRLLEPLGYLDFLSLTASAGLVITDSGGIQEETTYLGIPCLTVRSSTERPITISQGSNQLVASTKDAILGAFADTWGKPVAAERRPPFWDGHTAERIVEVMLSLTF